MLLNGFEKILDKYDLFIVDVWGVVYDEGDGAFPGVIPLLTKIKNLNKKLVFLSNSPQQSLAVQEILNKLKITDDLYTRVHTSGMEVKYLFEENEFSYLGNKCFMVDAKTEILDGIKNIQLVDNLDEADFVFLSKITERTNLLHYNPLVEQIAVRNLPVICPNPDIFVVISGGTKLYCQGAIAKMCEKKGIPVKYIGKPHSSVYKRIISWYPTNKDRILVVGDNPNTDIKGGNDSEIDSAFITNGMHASVLHDETGLLNQQSLQKLMYDINVTPTYTVEWFKL